MQEPPADPPACFDLKLLAFIGRRGGEVSVRQLTRGMGACRPAGAARAKLDALVRAGMGVWWHEASGRRGGRPSPVFRCTLSAEALQGLMGLAQGAARAIRPGWMRLIMCEVIAFLNQPIYRATRCEHLAEALREVAKNLDWMGESEPDLPLFKREMRMNGRGRLAGCWTFHSPWSGVGFLNGQTESCDRTPIPSR